MSGRIVSWTVAAVLAVTLPLHGLALWLGWSRSPLEGVLEFTGLDVLWILSFVAFEAVGAVIVLKQPRHPIGWLLLAAGGAHAVAAAVVEYATRALLVDPTLPGGEITAWLSVWTWPFGIVLIVVALVLFPTGRPPSPRWWSVVWLAVAAPVLVAVANAVDLWGLRGPRLLLDPDAVLADRWSMQVMAVAFPVFLLSAVLAMTGLVVRYRRSRGEERAQLKLLALAAGVGAVALVASQTVVTSGPAGAVAEAVSTPGWFAVAAGVAILRYRLFEIDRLISRTVSYVLLTLALAAVYGAGVVGLGAVARAVTGGGGGDLVVAASTLAVAGLFGPSRRRVQAAVDRRFNRARYDARRTVDAFTQGLRQQVDLAALVTDLEAAARSALQPRQLSVWLAPAPGNRGDAP